MALDGIGSRNVLAQGAATLSGDFRCGASESRQPRGASTISWTIHSLIQSEVEILDDSDQVDKSFPALDYH
jgi:hypothetical protein